MLSRIPILVTMLGAIASVLSGFGPILKASFVPVLLIVGLDTIATAYSESTFARIVIWVLEWIPATLIAVAVHRTILLGPASLTNPWSLSWSRRETSFLTQFVILHVVLLMATLASGLVAWMLPETWMIMLAVLVFATWLGARLSMVLPAAALDRTMRLSNSWYLTSGNDIPLTVIMGLPLVFLFAWLRFVLVFEAAAVASVLAVIGVVFCSALMIAVLSKSYQYLYDEASEP